MTVEPWDREKALEQIGGDPELLDELIALFLDDSDQLIDKIRSAVAGTDPLQLEHAAHAFKGSAMNFAADRTRDLAFELESMGRNSDLSGASAVLSQLEEEYGRLAASMRG